MSSFAFPERRAAVGPLAERQLALWRALLEFAERMPGPWTLIGGLMTSVLVAEHAGLDGPIARVTKDADVVGIAEGSDNPNPPDGVSRAPNPLAPRHIV